jgi:hypothetical protein
VVVICRPVREVFCRRCERFQCVSHPFDRTQPLHGCYYQTQLLFDVVGPGLAWWGIKRRSATSRDVPANLHSRFVLTNYAILLGKAERSGAHQIPPWVLRLPPPRVPWPFGRRAVGDLPLKHSEVHGVLKIDHSGRQQLVVAVLIVVLRRPSLDRDLPLALGADRFHRCHAALLRI